MKIECPNFIDLIYGGSLVTLLLACLIALGCLFLAAVLAHPQRRQYADYAYMILRAQFSINLLLVLMLFIEPFSYLSLEPWRMLPQSTVNALYMAVAGGIYLTCAAIFTKFVTKKSPQCNWCATGSIAMSIADVAAFMIMILVLNFRFAGI